MSTYFSAVERLGFYMIDCYVSAGLFLAVYNIFLKIPNYYYYTLSCSCLISYWTWLAGFNCLLLVPLLYCLLVYPAFIVPDWESSLRFPVWLVNNFDLEKSLFFAFSLIKYSAAPGI